MSELDAIKASIGGLDVLTDMFTIEDPSDLDDHREKLTIEQPILDVGLLPDNHDVVKSVPEESNMTVDNKAIYKKTDNKLKDNRKGKSGRRTIEDSLESLATERRKLERENEEKQKQLDKLKKKEAAMLEAARKGGSMDEFVDQSDEELDEQVDVSNKSAHGDTGSNSGQVEDEEEMQDDEEEMQDDEEYVTADVASGCGDEVDDNDVSDSDVEGSEAADNVDSDNGRGSNHRDSASQHSNASHNSKKVTGAKSEVILKRKHIHSRSKISPIEWKKSASRSRSPIPVKKSSRRSPPPPHRGSPPSREYLSKLKHLFRDTKYFLIKSNNYENVGLAQAKGVWSTPPLNEERLNTAFKNSSNVILIFSVKESGKFQGFARIAAVSDRNHPPIRWVLPVGLSARALNGVFTIDWINRQELSFGKALYIRNAWNFDQAVKIGRDGQEIDPKSGEELCRQFLPDRRVDISAIVQKSKQALTKRGMDNPEPIKKDIHLSVERSRKERPPARVINRSRVDHRSEQIWRDERCHQVRKPESSRHEFRHRRADSPVEKRRRLSSPHREDNSRRGSLPERRPERSVFSNGAIYGDYSHEIRGGLPPLPPHTFDLLPPLFSGRMRTTLPPPYPLARNSKDFNVSMSYVPPASLSKRSAYDREMDEFLYRVSHVGHDNHHRGSDRYRDGR